MKTELEVARDAVRAALGDELADALEWAAAAVSMKPKLEASLLRLREFEAHFGYGPVDEAVRRGSMLARADATDAMAFVMENITASQAAARRAERLRSAAELLNQADPDRLTYSAGTAQFWPTPARNALLSATLESDPPQTPYVWDGQWPVAHADSPSVVDADVGT